MMTLWSFFFEIIFFFFFGYDEAPLETVTNPLKRTNAQTLKLCESISFPFIFIAYA